MMDKTEKAAAVRELQEALRRLAREYPVLPGLSVDGVYGPETAEAVRGVQRLFGLPVTGEADTPTWDAVQAEARRLSPPATPFFPAEPGDRGGGVLMLEGLLAQLSQEHKGLPASDGTGEYNGATTAAVKAWQHLFGLKETGRADPRTLYLLWRTLQAYEGL